MQAIDRICSQNEFYQTQGRTLRRLTFCTGFSVPLKRSMLSSSNLALVRVSEKSSPSNRDSTSTRTWWAASWSWFSRITTNRTHIERSISELIDQSHFIQQYKMPPFVSQGKVTKNHICASQKHAFSEKLLNLSSYISNMPLFDKFSHLLSFYFQIHRNASCISCM